MIFKRRALYFSLQIIAILACALALSATAIMTQAYIAIFLFLIIFCFQSFLLYQSVSTSSIETARFIKAIEFADFNQSFNTQKLPYELSHALNTAMHKLNAISISREAELQQLKRVLEQAPTALVTVDASNRVTCLNAAARTLLDQSHSDPIVLTKLNNHDIAKALSEISAGERRLIKTHKDSVPQRIALFATGMVVLKNSILIVAIEDIQSELGTAEFDAWHDLIRVLTHEIMNTVTPIVSLAAVAKDLTNSVTNELDQGTNNESLKDLRDAINGVANRTKGLQRFIQSYRKIARMPQPRSLEINTKDFLNDIAVLMQDTLKNIDFQISIAPNTESFICDRDLMHQAIVNLLLNARDSFQSSSIPNPTIRINMHKPDAEKTTISISDNGTGVPDKAKERIFVPFFTTKQKGTGIGLSLVRQIALAHGGYVTYQENLPHGSIFSIILPAS